MNPSPARSLAPGGYAYGSIPHCSVHGVGRTPSVRRDRRGTQTASAGPSPLSAVDHRPPVENPHPQTSDRRSAVNPRCLRTQLGTSQRALRAHGDCGISGPADPQAPWAHGACGFRGPPDDEDCGHTGTAGHRRPGLTDAPGSRGLCVPRIYATCGLRSAPGRDQQTPRDHGAPDSLVCGPRRRRPAGDVTPSRTFRRGRVLPRPSATAACQYLPPAAPTTPVLPPATTCRCLADDCHPPQPPAHVRRTHRRRPPIRATSHRRPQDPPAPPDGVGRARCVAVRRWPAFG